MKLHTNQLIAEIEFWREMIDSRDSGLPENSLQRMRQALALAERKLELLQIDDEEMSTAWTEPVSAEVSKH